MTLLVAWRSTDGIHMVSDTRLNLGGKFVDQGIKILSAPYRIYGPGEKTPDNILAQGDLGMGFAGSALAALTLTATMRDVLTVMQGAPPFSDVGMEGIVDLLWRTYNTQQRALTEIMFENGLATVLVAGYCAVHGRQRAFLLDVSSQYERTIREVLLHPGDVEVLGSGKAAAKALMAPHPAQRDIVRTVQAVIDDDTVPTVGGPIQFGELKGTIFRTVGVLTNSNRTVHHWRGGLDLNDPELTRRSGLVVGYPLLDLYKPHTPTAHDVNGDA